MAKNQNIFIFFLEVGYPNPRKEILATEKLYIVSVCITILYRVSGMTKQLPKQKTPKKEKKEEVASYEFLKSDETT